MGGNDRRYVAEGDGGALACPGPAAAGAARLVSEIGCGSVSFWLSGLLG